VADYFGAERAREMAAHLVAFAASFGVEGLAQRDRIPNTRKALAMAEFARDRGRLHPLRHAVMEAYWRGGRDIEDDAVLADCAREAGLDAREALAAIVDPAYRARVDAMGVEAQRVGVTGIPTFVMGHHGVVGCQPYEVLAALAEAEGAARR
jgi:predicted DsbA family dithiol-disulfide isomerase